MGSLSFKLKNNKGESLVYNRGYSRLSQIILIIGDLIFLNSSFLVAYGFRFNKNPFNYSHDYVPSLLFICNLAWIVCIYLLNSYTIARVRSWDTIIWNIIKAIVFHALIISMYLLSVKGYSYSRIFFAFLYTTLSIAIFSWRVIFIYLIKKLRKTGYNNRKVIIVGTNKASFKINHYFQSEKSEGYHLKAIFSDSTEELKNSRTTILPEKSLFKYLSNEKVDELYCALPLTEVKKIREIMSFAENNMIRFRYVPDFRALLYKKVDIEFYDQVPILSVRKEPLENISKRLAKRIFDILFSLSVIILVMPLLLIVISIIIKIQSKGPIIFKQLRSGKNNKVFYCYKFRTMVVNAKADTVQATKDDVRITPIGRFLRKTNLDEFPQFFNVLKGDMSIVGPRPHMVKHTEEYQKTVDKFMIRHFVKPGITGWAQVNGHRGTTEKPQKIIKRVRYDVWYIENWSMLLDLKIIFMTLFNMYKGEKNAL